MGWTFLVFGASLSFLFVPQVDLTSWYWYQGPIQTTRARVDACWDTGESVGGGAGTRGRPIYANEFSFVTYDLNYRGLSYSVGRCGADARAARAEFPRGRPDLARLLGCRRKPFGLWALLVLVLPLAGAALVVRAFASGAGRLKREEPREEPPAAQAVALLALPLLALFVSACLFLRTMLRY